MFEINICIPTLNNMFVNLHCHGVDLGWPSWHYGKYVHMYVFHKIMYIHALYTVGL